MTENENNNIREKVLAAIHKGDIAMRPKWHFILKAALGIIGGLLIVLTLVYLASFIVFNLRQTGVLFEPMFGGRAWIAFFASLPWLLILLAGVFIIILELLVEKYSLAYRQPLLYSVLAIVAIVILGGILLAPFHRELFRRARRGESPFAGNLYRRFGLERFGEVHRGRVIATSTAGFILQDDEGATSSVNILPPPLTRIPPGTDIEPGDTVVVFGNAASGTIIAEGVLEITP